MSNAVENGLSHVGEGGAHYQQFCGLSSDDAWCAAWISTILHESGEAAALQGHKITSVAGFRDFFIQTNSYKRKGTYTPQVGDVVVMKTDGKGSEYKGLGSHVALITKVYPDGSFDTVEGNRTLNRVKQVITDHYSGNEIYISGYGQLNYQNPPPEGGYYSGTAGTNSAGNSGSFGDGSGSLDVDGGLPTGVGVNDYEDYVVQEGDTWDSIAAKKHVSRESLLKYNNADGWTEPIPGTTIKVPKSKWTLIDAAEAGTESVAKAHTKSIKVYHPVIKAEFYAESGMLSAVGEITEDKVWGDKDLDFDIISCNTQRSLSADCASMTITLTNRRDWYNILSSNDLVIIKMQRPEFGENADELHEEEQEVFIGVIDDIRKSLDFSSGQPRRAVQVTARGMGKAFVNFDVGLIENITILTPQSTGFMKDLMNLNGKNSSQAIETIWDNFVGKGIQYQFYKGNLTNYIEYDGSSEREEEKLIDCSSYSQYSGSLWNFIKELSNLPFNETFWEIRDGKTVLFHRKTPFNPEEWNTLNRRIIYDDDIVTDSTGRSDLETYTVFIVNMRFVTAGVKQLFNPLWYYPYYCQYGLSQLEVTSTYENQGGDLAEAMKNYSMDLFNWNIKNNKFANGQIVVKGRASYKIGEIIVLEYCNLEFYVEGVAHNFTVYGGWTTTLSVTRGMEPEERFEPPWGQAEEMTSDAMTKIVELTGGEDVDFTDIKLDDTTQFHITGGSGTNYAGNSGSFGSFGSSAGTSVGSIGAAGGSENGLGPQNNAAPGTHTVPNTFKQTGITADDYTVGTRSDWSGNSKKIYEAWKAGGSAHEGPLMTLKDDQGVTRYLVATVIPEGYKITVVLEDGTRIPCITMDVKGSDRYTQAGASTPGADWGHYKGNNQYSVVELEVLSQRGGGTWEAVHSYIENNTNWSGKRVAQIFVEGAA